MAWAAAGTGYLERLGYQLLGRGGRRTLEAQVVGARLPGESARPARRSRLSLPGYVVDPV